MVHFPSIAVKKPAVAEMDVSGVVVGVGNIYDCTIEYN